MSDEWGLLKTQLKILDGSRIADLQLMAQSSRLAANSEQRVACDSSLITHLIPFSYSQVVS
jgi:hypothetical protein